jgi:hypothetical protein
MVRRLYEIDPRRMIKLEERLNKDNGKEQQKRVEKMIQEGGDVSK